MRAEVLGIWGDFGLRVLGFGDLGVSDFGLGDRGVAGIWGLGFTRRVWGIGV